MKSLGVAAKVSRTPKALCVMLDDSSGTPCVADAFDLTTSGVSLVERLRDLAQQLAGRLPGLNPDVVVVQRADVAPVASNQQSRAERLLVEGALVYVSMSGGHPTLLRNGRETGTACGSDKATALAEGSQLDASRPEAAAAALSGIRQPSE